MILDALPITYQTIVTEKQLDLMGHMNVMWYTHFFDEGTWRFFEAIGMGVTYFQANQAGAFALEQHTRYLAEVRLGDAVTVRTRALGRSAKRLHFMHFMSLDHSGVLAATTELVGIHIDRAVRRSSPFPTHIAVTIDHALAEHQRLDWEPPLSGVMNA